MVFFSYADLLTAPKCQKAQWIADPKAQNVFIDLIIWGGVMGFMQQALWLIQSVRKDCAP
jgi:hypothetical protein